MSNKNSEEQNKLQKRLAYSRKHFRVLRTGGVAVTKTFKKDGVGAALNTKHGTVRTNDYLKALEWVSKR